MVRVWQGVERKRRGREASTEVGGEVHVCDYVMNLLYDQADLFFSREHVANHSQNIEIAASQEVSRRQRRWKRKRVDGGEETYVVAHCTKKKKTTLLVICSRDIG